MFATVYNSINTPFDPHSLLGERALTYTASHRETRVGDNDISHGGKIYGTSKHHCHRSQGWC